MSIALATFNGAEYLARQLEDLATQTRLPQELVVCDDASSDRTFSILEEFAASAPFPVYIYHNDVRLGYRANFLKCANLCHSDLIAFCDQDDRWLSNKLDRVVSCFRDPEIVLVFHNADVMNADGNRIARLYHEDAWPAVLPPLTGSPWQFALGFTQIFRRSLLAYDGWWKTSEDPNTEYQPLAHDQWYFFLASVFGTTLYIPDILTSYRQHGSNTFGWRRVALPFMARVRREVKGARNSMRRRTSAAEQRARLLQSIADLNDERSDRAAAGVKMYKALAARCALRSALYEAPDFYRRVSAFTRLVRADAYGGSPWHLGRMALAMDAIVGIGGLYSRVDKSV